MLGEEQKTEALEPDRAKDTLASQVRQAVRTACRQPSGFPQALRIEVPITYTDPFVWLRAQPADTRIYWADREH